MKFLMFRLKLELRVITLKTAIEKKKSKEITFKEQQRKALYCYHNIEKNTHTHNLCTKNYFVLCIMTSYSTIREKDNRKLEIMYIRDDYLFM